MNEVTKTDEANPDLFAALKMLNLQLGRDRMALALSVFCATISVVFELLPIWFSYDLIRALVTGTAAVTDFINYGLVLLIVIPVGYILFGFATTQSHRVAFTLLHRLRMRVASRLARLPLGYFSNKKSGAVRKLMIDEPERLELIIAHAIPEGVSALISWLAVSAWLFWMDWRMALASIVLTPISFFMMGMAIKGSMPQMNEYKIANTHLNGVIAEFLAGISAIKIFRSDDKNRTEAEDAIRNFADKQSEAGRRWVPLGGTFYALILANICVILPVGAWFYSAGTLGLPELLFFVILGGNYSSPLMRIFNLFHQVAHISMAAGLLQDTLDEVAQLDTEAELQLDNHDITFDAVNFAYDEVQVLHSVSFTARTGQATALVGPSGSGKSTLANLIVRFYDIPSGQITMGGQDISKMGRAQLMRELSFVFQDTFLFAGTIAENLQFAKPNATDNELHAAAKAAQAHEFIMALPAGYETIIGDGGQALSGGEKQRIALARAILKDAPVIVLDEATAFADPDCEAEIQKAISALTADKTVIVVAHRLHTIASADNIVVLDNGRIVENDTHQNLLKLEGLYSRMWNDYMATRGLGLRPNTQQSEVSS